MPLATVPVGDGIKSCCKAAPANGGPQPRTGYAGLAAMQAADLDGRNPQTCYSHDDSVFRVFEDSKGGIWASAQSRSVEGPVDAMGPADQRRLSTFRPPGFRASLPTIW